MRQGSSDFRHLEDPVLGSVNDEIGELSRRSAVDVLSHVVAVYQGRTDPDGLQVWRQHEDVRLYLAESHGELVVYGVRQVLDEGRPGLQVGLLFAGCRKNGCPNWNGQDDEMLWQKVVLPRCRFMFAN